jgi:hypothetical protein
MIARDNRVVSIGFEGVEKRERGLGVEVTHAELRDGAFHPLSWDAEPELPGVSIGEDLCRLAPVRPGRCSLKKVARWWASSSSDVRGSLQQSRRLTDVRHHT